MRFSQDSANHGYIIQSVSSKGVTVRSPEGDLILLESSFIISSEKLITGWEPASIEELRPGHFVSILSLKPEVILLGVGKKMRFPPHALLTPLMEAGIGCEVMDSMAACRTYNVLNSEGRQVAAALLLP